jgi:CRP-like cAMP-binding protein
MADGLDLEAVLRLGTTLRVPRGSVLIREGAVSASVYFVRQGALRTFSTPKGRDVTFQFFFEGDFVSSLESYRARTPSRFSLEAIEDAVVVRLGRAALEADASRARVGAFLSEYLPRRLEAYMRRVESLITESALERYVRLRRESPELVARVRQRYLASYLGVTPVSLSRLRRQLARR